jgi:hypothetical protein
MKWVKSLNLNNDEKIEDRLYQLLSHVEITLSEAQCILTDIDATGNLGGILTNLINLNPFLNVTLTMLLTLTEEVNLV